MNKLSIYTTFNTKNLIISSISLADATPKLVDGFRLAARQLRMYYHDHSTIFFSIGRGSFSLESSIVQYLHDNTITTLTSASEDWAFFYLQKDRRQLIFGRDIFARKSLCWRTSLSENNNRLFEISTFPAAGPESGWHEIFPGTFFIFFFRDSYNLANVLTLPNEHIPEHFVLRCLAFSTQVQADTTTRAVSFFNRSALVEDALVKQFSISNFVQLNGSRLLKPCADVIVDVSDSLLSATIVEFHRRFVECVRGILTRAASENNDRTRQQRIAVLFSGGVDSLLVALIAGEQVCRGTEILLINVAFGDSDAQCNDAPDRLRSKNAFKFLRKTAKAGVYFRLIFVDVGRKELVECRRSAISAAIAPLNSVLDDSLGCVLWFACRARGVEFVDDENAKDDATRRPVVDFSGRADIDVVLVGSGADEQLGGYARHRTVFERFGYARLADELAMELERMGRRNYGRDDRIAISHGRTLMSPFLVEPFVEWLNGVPLTLKVDYSLPRGEGEKRLLRLVLTRQCGVPAPLAAQPKRAMQFGSRIAKFENRREKGSEICERLARKIDEEFSNISVKN